MSTAVQAAIEAAKAQGASATQALSTQPRVTNAVAAYTAPSKMTLDDLDSGLNVDGFIQPKSEGLTIKLQNADEKAKPSIIDEIFATFNATFNATVFEGAKYGNNPTVYIKTFDGVKEARGGSWETALNKAKLADPTVYTYKGADLEFKVAQDVLDVRGKVAVVKGTVLGHSTTPTGLKNFKKLIKTLEIANLKNEEVLVKITNEARSANGNNWGVLDFELIGPAPEESE